MKFRFAVARLASMINPSALVADARLCQSDPLLGRVEGVDVCNNEGKKRAVARSRRPALTRRSSKLVEETLRAGETNYSDSRLLAIAR